MKRKSKGERLEKRYKIFHRYDEGVMLSDEAWYETTPEKLAVHHAQRCCCGVVIDAFCGVGGNTIQLAQTCDHVVAIDSSPETIEMARHNAKVYGVDKRIDFIVGDFIALSSSLRGDVVFLSPPWGGPQYKDTDVFDVETMLVPRASVILEAARRISTDIAFYLPRTIDSNQVASCGLNGETVEIEYNYFRDWLTACTVYFGQLAM